MSTLGTQFTVTAPAQASACSLVFTRRGRVFQTIEAATALARRTNGRVHPFGSNAILADFSNGFELQVMPDMGHRQTPAQALQARGLQ